MALYTFTKSDVDVDLLHKEITDNATILTVLTGVELRAPDALTVDMLTSLPGGEETELNTVVSDHVAVPLSVYKQNKYDAIDKRTKELIDAGFTYSSKTFSLSDQAQKNCESFKCNTAEFTWPADVTTIYDDTYSLAQANVDAFWTAGKDALNGHLDSGRALKKSVFDATDKAGVDAVVDNR